jgi:predicted DNA-binding protein YlxM (UPF0122 family)
MEGSYRGKIDLLRSRVELLTGKDKLLLTMYLDKGNSFRQMAQLAGVNETIIARRIRKLMKRLTDGQYVTCLGNASKFTEAQIAIAKDYFLLGLSMKRIARKRRRTYYYIRQNLKRIQEIIATIRRDPA